MSTGNRYALPPWPETGDGSSRRVGFELEFAGLSFRETVEQVRDALGGEAEFHSQAEAVVRCDGLDEFVVEVDSELAKSLAQWRAGEVGDDFANDRLAEWLVNLTTEIVPLEVVCPPIAIPELHRLDPMVDALRDAGALGTAESLVYAFGLHINPELPALEPGVICAYLRAYALAQSWLVERHRVDLARRVTPYIDLYPKKYIRRVLAYSGDEPMATLIDDYLADNPTRNRALDMLPLFREVDEERVLATVDDSRIKARPTFHYRLPNCEIDNPDWCLSQSWRLWCVLEELARDGALLDRLAGEYLEHDKSLLPLKSPSWFDTLDEILSGLE